MSWRVVYTKQAQRDAKKLSASGLKSKAQQLLSILSEDPYRNPPPFEKLVGDLVGAYSRRINIQHRLVYQVLDDRRVVKVMRLWSHYEQSPPWFRARQHAYETNSPLAATATDPPKSQAHPTRSAASWPQTRPSTKKSMASPSLRSIARRRRTR